MGHSDDYLHDDKSTRNIPIPTPSVSSAPDLSTSMSNPSTYGLSDPTPSIPTTLTTKTTNSPSAVDGASSISSTPSFSSEFISSSTSSNAPIKTSSANLQANDFNNQNQNFWESLTQGVKAGIILAVIVGIV